MKKLIEWFIDNGADILLTLSLAICLFLYIVQMISLFILIKITF